MKKYIAIQSSYNDFDYLIDDCALTPEAGINSEVFIYAGGDSCYLNDDVYEDIYTTIEDVIAGFNDIYEGDYSYYRNYKDVIKSCLTDNRYKGYSPKLVKDLKNFVENYSDSLDNFTEFLTITTGKTWMIKEYRGYSYDRCILIYCEELHSAEYMDLIGNAAVGCATEFGISETPVEVEGKDAEEIANEADFVYGYWMTDDDIWRDAKEKLSEITGINPDDFLIITMEEKTTRYIEYEIA